MHESFGTNWRMLETQAAIGRIQLRRMPAWSAQRRANAQKIAAACRGHAVVRVPAVPAGIEHAYYKFYAFVEPERLVDGWTRERIVDEIAARGVPCLQGTCPEVYMEQAFAGTGFRPRERLKVARELGETSLMFLVHPTLTDEEMDKTCRTIGDVLTMAGPAR